jgi:hypothetical protein
MRVTERWKERKFGRKLGSDGITVSYTAERVWDVDGVTNELDAIDAVAEASIGAGYDTRAGLSVVGNDAQEEHKGLWAVRAQYATNPNSGDTGGSGGESSVSFLWEDSGEDFATDADIFGNPLLNSALDPFDGGWNRAVSTGFYTVFLIQPYFDAQEAARYRNRVMDDELVTPFGTFAPLESKCLSIRPTSEVLPKQNRIKVAFRFEIRAKSEWPEMPSTMSPWDISFIDQGTHGWADDNKVYDIIGPNNPFTLKSALLNGKGIPFDSSSAKLYGNKTPKEIDTPAGALIQDRPKCKMLYYYGCLRAKAADLNLPKSL